MKKSKNLLRGCLRASASPRLHWIFIFVTIALATAGCWRKHSDMGTQDKYTTYQQSDQFSDGASERVPVAGTVPRDEVQISRDRMPFPVSRDVILRGGEQFEIYCSACHGRLGNGQGMIVHRGLTRPPSFHIDRLKTAPDTHFYDVISNGYGQMLSYNERIAPQQRWEIVAYIRALQQAGTDAPADVKTALVAAGDHATQTGHLR